MPATSQMRCWLLPNGRIFPAAAGFSALDRRIVSAFFCVARTAAQRWLLHRCCAHHRSLLGKPHTAATRASRRAAGARRARRVDRADCFTGRKSALSARLSEIHRLPLLRYVSAKTPFSLRAATLSRTSRVTFLGVMPRLPSGSIFADSADGEPRYVESARSNSERSFVS